MRSMPPVLFKASAKGRPGFAAACHPGQPLAHRVGDTGAHQPLADDEQRGDQQHRGIAEAGHRFLRRQHAAETEGDDHQQRRYIQSHAIAYEQDDGRQQQAEYEQGVSRRGLSASYSYFTVNMMCKV